MRPAPASPRPPLRTLRAEPVAFPLRTTLIAFLFAATILPILVYAFRFIPEGISSLAHTLAAPGEVPRLAILFARSAALALLAAAFASAAGFYAFVLHEQSAPQTRALLLAALLLLFVIPLHMQAIGWIQAFGRAGWITTLLAPLGISPDAPPAILYSIPGAAAVMASHYFPLCFVLSFAARRTIPAPLIESSLLTLTPVAIWRLAFTGWLRPWLLAGGLITFNAALLDYATGSLLRQRTFSLEIMHAYDMNYDEGRAAALCLPLAALTLVTSALCIKLLFRRAARAIPRAQRPLPTLDGSPTRAIEVIAVLLLTLGLLVPIVTLIKMSGGADSYRTVFTTGRSQAAATLTCAFTTALGVTLAAIVWPRRRKGALAAGLLLLGLPAPVAALAHIHFWNAAPPLPASLLAPLHFIHDSGAMLPLGLITLFLPAGLLIFAMTANSSGAGQPHSATHSHQSATSPGILSTHWWLAKAPPLARPALWTFLLAFILAAQEAHATLLLAAPGQETLSVRAYTLLHFAPDAVVAAFCIVSSALILGSAAIISLLFRIARVMLMRLHPEVRID